MILWRLPGHRNIWGAHLTEPTSFEIAEHRVRFLPPYQWVIEKPVIRTKKGTKETYLDYELLAYCDNLHKAAQRLFEEELRGKGPTNVQGLAKLIEYAKLDIIKAVTDGLDKLDKHIVRLPDNEQRNRAIATVDAAIGKNLRQKKVNPETGEIRNG